MYGYMYDGWIESWILYMYYLENCMIAGCFHCIPKTSVPFTSIFNPFLPTYETCILSFSGSKH